MVDDFNNPQDRANTTASSGSNSAPVGYCQECGRALTVGNVQRVANGVFCPVCATQRQSTPGWQSVPGGSYPGGGRPATPSAADGNPVLAGLLGLIPGVGAMFNGQYAKGALHLIVFVVLVTLADNLNSVFYWLVWGWVFYQAFDAYHTARARRDGLPLPNPFGWNEVGDRLGFNRTSPPSPPTARPNAASHESFASQWQVDPSQWRTDAWTGYVPPSAFAQAPPKSYTPPVQEATTPVSDNPYAAPYEPPVQPSASYTPPPYNPGVPYVPTYVGAVPPGAAAPQAPLPRSRRFPIGAVWLIGLGIVFLLGNLMPGFHVSGQWLVPLILAALALWGAFRRWEQFRIASGTLGKSPNLASAMTGPAVLLTVSVLLTMDAANVLALHRSWPVLLVVWGSLLLLQRSSAPSMPLPLPEMSERGSAAGPAAAPTPVRSTSGTGSLGL